MDRFILQAKLYVSWKNRITLVKFVNAALKNDKHLQTLKLKNLRYRKYFIYALYYVNRSPTKSFFREYFYYFWC